MASCKWFIFDYLLTNLQRNSFGPLANKPLAKVCDLLAKHLPTTNEGFFATCKGVLLDSKPCVKAFQGYFQTNQLAK